MFNPFTSLQKTFLFCAASLTTTFVFSQQSDVLPNNDCYSMEIPSGWTHDKGPKGSFYNLNNGTLFSPITIAAANTSGAIDIFSKNTRGVTFAWDTLDGYVVNTASGKISNNEGVFYSYSYLFDNTYKTYALTFNTEEAAMPKRQNSVSDGLKTFHFKTKEYWCNDFTAKHPVIWNVSTIADNSWFFNMCLQSPSNQKEFIAIQRISWPIKSLEDEIKKYIKQFKKDKNYQDIQTTDVAFAGMPSKKITYLYMGNITVQHYVTVKDKFYTVHYSYPASNASLFTNMVARWEASCFKWN
ncbi:MAG: hypothetical protein ACXVPN_09700 [Bacteroidia bacterium]